MISAAKLVKQVSAYPWAQWSLLRWQTRPGNLLILAYHRVLPASSQELSWEQPGVVVFPDLFAAHLSILKRHFQLVQLSELQFDQPRFGLGKDNYCCITFDDGWRDNYDYAFPVLKNHGVPATIFLSTGFIGAEKLFWPGRLSKLLQRLSSTPDLLQTSDDATTSDSVEWLRRTLPTENLPGFATPEWLSRAIEIAKRDPDATIENHLERLESKWPDVGRPERAVLTWEEVVEMQDSGLVRFGCHTMTHRRLGRVEDPRTLQSQLDHSKATIEHHIGQPVTVFAYPNGDHCPQSEAHVSRVYQAAVSTEPGTNDLRQPSRYRLRRINMHSAVGRSRSRFISRLGGW